MPEDLRRRARRTVRALTVTRSGRRVGDAAAEAAFFVALAVLPTMLVTTTVLRALRPVLGGDAGPDVEAGLAGLLRVVLTSRGGAAADAANDLLTHDNGGLLTLGTVVSVVVMTRAMRSVLTGLHAVGGPLPARKEYSTRRLWLSAAGLGVLSVGLAALALAMFAVGPILGHVRDLAPGAERAVALVWIVVRWPVAAACLVGLIGLVHTAGLRRARPSISRHRARRAALTGAVSTASGAVAASVLLPVYVHEASRFSPTVGAMGGGLILLLWAYLLVLSVLVGAQVRVGMWGRPATLAETDPEPVGRALAPVPTSEPGRVSATQPS